MDIKELKEILEILQPLMLILAAIIGGIWAIVRFWSLGELKKAKAELKLIQDNLDKKGELNITLDWKILPHTDKFEYLIQVSVEIENFGNKSEYLSWNDGGIKCAKVSDIENDNIKLKDWRNIALVGWGGIRNSSVLAAGHKKTYHFIIEFKSKGLYYILFNVKGSPETTTRYKKEMNKTGEEDELPTLWASELFITVKEENDA